MWANGSIGCDGEDCSGSHSTETQAMIRRTMVWMTALTSDKPTGFYEEVK